METKRQVGSSSSFTADLFGSKDSSSSSSKGIFSSIFPPPSSVGGKNSSGSKVLESWPKQPLEGSAWRQAPLPNKEERVEPCHLSSSLYYGGQDLYSHPSTCQTSTTSYPVFKKDGGEDDTNGNNSMDASRGNWWQGTGFLFESFKLVRFIIRLIFPMHLKFSKEFIKQAKPIIMEEHKSMNKLPTLWISNRFSNTFFHNFSPENEA
ncbi:hypothetical protein CXB51_012714 [Gossypium anomalum]|uniref:Uncharacterized protein n=1 Tax=Gossypium anomalum TaxID=47600 RepID=A0A8J5ZC18_9ROSI|nr:hypothetical protein CXB51_012714 [Gossypium anomalum]